MGSNPCRVVSLCGHELLTASSMKSRRRCWSWFSRGQGGIREEKSQWQRWRDYTGSGEATPSALRACCSSLLSSRSSFMTVRLWTLLADSQKEAPKKTPRLLLGARANERVRGKNQRLCGPTGMSSGNCQETENRMIRTCHAL